RHRPYYLYAQLDNRLHDSGVLAMLQSKSRDQGSSPVMEPLISCLFPFRSTPIDTMLVDLTASPCLEGHGYRRQRSDKTPLLSESYLNTVKIVFGLSDIKASKALA